MLRSQGQRVITKEGVVMFIVTENSYKIKTLKCRLDLLSQKCLTKALSMECWEYKPDRNE